MACVACVRVCTVHATNGPAFASTFASTGGDGEVFISVVSFGSRPGGTLPPANASVYADAWFEIDAMYGAEHGYRLFDCYLGQELSLPNSSRNDTKLNVTFTIEASYDSLKGVHGFSGFTGLLLAKNETVDASLLAFLKRMQRLTVGKPLVSVPCYGFMWCVWIHKMIATELDLSLVLSYLACTGCHAETFVILL